MHSLVNFPTRCVNLVTTKVMALGSLGFVGLFRSITRSSEGTAKQCQA